MKKKREDLLNQNEIKDVTTDSTEIQRIRDDLMHNYMPTN